jgi:anaerobic selenocysteine-containing dehydrogenase
MSDDITKVSRRDFLKTGAQVGAALGVAGLGGLTILGGSDAQAGERKYAWDNLPAGEKAPSTKLQLRTIGLGVSVQDSCVDWRSSTPAWEQ